MMKFAKIRISLTTKPIAYIYPYPPPQGETEAREALR